MKGHLRICPPDSKFRQSDTGLERPMMGRLQILHRKMDCLWTANVVEGPPDAQQTPALLKWKDDRQCVSAADSCSYPYSPSFIQYSLTAPRTLLPYTLVHRVEGVSAK